jgi:hypothetical protein
MLVARTACDAAQHPLFDALHVVSDVLGVDGVRKLVSKASHPWIVIKILILRPDHVPQLPSPSCSTLTSTAPILTS